MRRIIFTALMLVLLGSSAFADGFDDAAPSADLAALLDRAPILETLGFEPTLQFPRGVPLPGRAQRPRFQLFPGPKYLSVDFGVSWVPLMGGGTADDSTPHLAAYRKYWDSGWAVHADLHLRVLATADAYIGVSAVHHPTSGKRDWNTMDGTDAVHIRYRYDPLYIFPIEFGGKGYLPLKAPPGLRFLDPNRENPMLYLRIGAGPAFVNNVNIQFKRYVNGALDQDIDHVWWPTQAVLNVHIAVGLEWGSFRQGKGGAFGLFIEAGVRYLAAPVVTDFGDTSDPMLSATLSLGMHLP